MSINNLILLLLRRIKKRYKQYIVISVVVVLVGSCDDDSSTLENCGINTQYVITYDEPVNTAGYDIINAENCTYVISGKNSNKAWLMKVDELGNELWNQVYSDLSGLSRGNAVNHTSDGGLIIGGGINVFKTDPNGEIEWDYKLPYSNKHYVEDVIETVAGDYIVVGGVGGDPGTGGHGQKGQAYILRMSEGGDIQWVKRYGIANSPMDNFWGVVQADDGGFVLAGNKLHDRNFEFYDHFWVVKTDASGNKEWSHELGGNYWDEAQDIVKLSDDSYVIAGKKSLSQSNLDLWIMRISASGEILWQSNHGNNNYDAGMSLTVTENEDVVVAAGYTRSSSGSPFKYRVWGVDVNSGQILWNKKHGGNQDDKAYGVVEAYDGGFIVIGSTDSFGEGYTKLWIVKTDSEGNTVDYP